MFTRLWPVNWYFGTKYFVRFRLVSALGWFYCNCKTTSGNEHSEILIFTVTILPLNNTSIFEYRLSLLGFSTNIVQVMIMLTIYGHVDSITPTFHKNNEVVLVRRNLWKLLSAFCPNNEATLHMNMEWITSHDSKL